MTFGDPIVTCTSCGQHYYLAVGHKCVDLKPFGNTEVIGAKDNPTKLCPNCGGLKPGGIVWVDKNSCCAICGNWVGTVQERDGTTFRIKKRIENEGDPGTKHDSGKPKFKLLPPEAVEQIVHVLTRGADKYQARNWEKGISYSRVYGALQRHLNEFWKGNNIDPEWGLHHLAHAGCCLLFLLTYEMRGMKKWDDRPTEDIT